MSLIISENQGCDGATTCRVTVLYCAGYHTSASWQFVLMLELNGDRSGRTRTYENKTSTMMRKRDWIMQGGGGFFGPPYRYQPATKQKSPWTSFLHNCRSRSHSRILPLNILLPTCTLRCDKFFCWARWGGGGGAKKAGLPLLHRFCGPITCLSSTVDRAASAAAASSMGKDTSQKKRTRFFSTHEDG